MNNKAQAVAITGMGIVTSLGKGIPIFKNGLFNGVSCFSRCSYPPLNFSIVGAFIQDYSMANVLQTLFQLPTNLTNERQSHLSKLLRRLPYPIHLAIISTLEAWLHAAFDKFIVDPTRMGLVVAAQNATSHYQYNLFTEFQQNPEFLSPTYALHFMDTDHVGILSDIFCIHGEGFTVGGSSASGNIALLRAYQMIQSGSQEVCLVVGALADLSPMELQGFYNIGALGGDHYIAEPNKACRPFDKKSDGFIYGQGSACLILESLASAKKRNIPILGYMLGGAAVMDGNYSANPSQVGEIRAMRLAIQTSGIAVDNIDYINTHGSSSPLGDQIEVAAIEKVLGTRSHDVLLNSTKSIVGHCLWSAGIIEAIATIIQMQEKFIHPNLNLEEAITEKCQFITGKSKLFSANISLSNSFGFAGINSALVFSANEKIEKN